MTKDIESGALSPRLSQAWQTRAEAPLTPGELDALLQRKTGKSVRSAATDAPMTRDPVTRKPMADPVLCSDGKLHDRVTVTALPYLDTDMTAGRALKVLGRDLEARKAVHKSFPVADAMLRNREALAAHIASARRPSSAAAGPSRALVPPGPRASAPATLTASASAPAAVSRPGLAADEVAYRKYQVRPRQSVMRFDQQNIFGRDEPGPRPLSFSLNTFSHFKVLPAWTGRRLVHHLVNSGVFVGSKRAGRWLSNTDALDTALDAFHSPKGFLTETEKDGVRKYVNFFDRMCRQGWRAGAEMDYYRRLFQENEHYRAITQARTPHESNIWRHDSEAMYLHWSALGQRIVRDRPYEPSTPVRKTGTVPAPKRSQSFDNLRLSDDPEALDPDVFYCPVFMEAAPAPVLCSDGHSYDLSQLMEGALTKSPLTREPMHVIGRHNEKQQYASRLIGKQDSAYFQETYEGLRDAYAPRVGGFEDRLVAYQRRKRFNDSGARPDAVSMHVFQKFCGMTKTQSEQLIEGLLQQGILSRALGRRISSRASKARLREALSKIVSGFETLGVSKRSDMVQVVYTLQQEQIRRQPLVAQAQSLAQELSLMPKGGTRYREVKERLEAVDSELRRLPSGAADTQSGVLY